MLFSFPPPRCEPGEALLSQTSSRPFYHCLDLDECGRRNKRAAASRKRGASPSSDGPRRPDTLSFVRAPGSAGAAPRAYAGPAPCSHLLTVRDGLGRRGRDRGGKKRRASQVRPASLDAPLRISPGLGPAWAAAPAFTARCPVFFLSTLRPLPRVVISM